MSTLWVSKYAPSRFSETVGNRDLMNVMQRYIFEPEAMPNLLLVGPPGCGKTTAIHVLSKCLYRNALGIQKKEKRMIDNRKRRAKEEKQKIRNEIREAKQRKRKEKQDRQDNIRKEKIAERLKKETINVVEEKNEIEQGTFDVIENVGSSNIIKDSDAANMDQTSDSESESDSDTSSSSDTVSESDDGAFLELSDLVLEMNASEQRGIDAIRKDVQSWLDQYLAFQNWTPNALIQLQREEKIARRKKKAEKKAAAEKETLKRAKVSSATAVQTVIKNDKNNISSDSESESSDDDPVISHPCPYRLVILDEFDSMTMEAQELLRKVMEKYSDRARFCLCANYPEKLHPAIVSRCSLLTFSKVEGPEVLFRILQICKKEKVTYDAAGLESLCFIADGDVRKAITLAEAVNLREGIRQQAGQDNHNDSAKSGNNNQLDSLFNQDARQKWGTDNQKYGTKNSTVIQLNSEHKKSGVHLLDSTEKKKHPFGGSASKSNPLDTTSFLMGASQLDQDESLLDVTHHKSYGSKKNIKKVDESSSINSDSESDSSDDDYNGVVDDLEQLVLQAQAFETQNIVRGPLKGSKKGSVTAGAGYFPNINPFSKFDTSTKIILSKQNVLSSADTPNYEIIRSALLSAIYGDNWREGVLPLKRLERKGFAVKDILTWMFRVVTELLDDVSGADYADNGFEDDDNDMQVEQEKNNEAQAEVDLNAGAVTNVASAKTIVSKKRFVAPIDTLTRIALLDLMSQAEKRMYQANNFSFMQLDALMMRIMIRCNSKAICGMIN